jgi:hypothetical protein
MLPNPEPSARTAAALRLSLAAVVARPVVIRGSVRHRERRRLFALLEEPRL